MQITEKPTSTNQVISPSQAKAPVKSFSLPFWQNLSIRWKLTVLLLLAAGIPVIVITQINLQFARASYLDSFKTTLKEKGRLFTTDFVQWGLDEAKSEAGTIAKSIQGTGIDLTDSNQVTKNRIFLQSLLQVSAQDVAPESIKNFKLITNVQGQTVAQISQVIAQDFALNPKLLPLGEISQPSYKTLNLPVGIEVGDLEIVKQSLKSGKPLNGTEIVKSTTLKSLGLSEQAAIAPRPQITQGLAAGKAPATVGTFDIEEGKIGLANIAVTPIIINGRTVGSVVVGGLLNRNYGVAEGFQQKLNVPVATIFAQDFRISTTVPYVDPNTKKQDDTRAIGTRVSQEVAESVLKNRQTFVGEANIIGSNYLTYYEPLFNHQNKAIGISFIGSSLAEIESNLNTLLVQSYGIGIISLILIGLIAGFAASTFSKPLTELSDFSKQIGSGKFTDRPLETTSTDEIGVLNTEMQKMAVSIQSNFESSNLQLAIADIAKNTQDLDSIFDLTVKGSKEILGADRVVVYQFNPDGGGTIVAEAVNDGLPKALNDKIEDACISQELIEAYKKGRVVPTRDVFNAGFHPDHLDLMKRLTIKSNLVTPIVTEEKLLGLLIAHFCYDTHDWRDGEVSILRQLALQLGLAIERINFIQSQKFESKQQRQEKENLQKRAMELLIEVDPISRGDLTVRAKVTEDEIGTVADSYNATVTSLRRIVTQVQTAAKEMADTTSSNESSVQDLSAEALRQAHEISEVLDRIQEMSNSSRSVTANAQKAETLVQQATVTLYEGDNAMNRTVDGILAIRATVAETSKKVKRLGESSQKISKVVNLISSFADQTNLLALNAAIEAARAGEEGRGFGVVANRVRSLARQSTAASIEIEGLIAEIQAETNEVVTAMETGTEQVVIGTRLVEEARQNLTKIAEASAQINALVEAIAAESLTQSKTSEIVTESMTDVAVIALNASSGADRVSNSFRDLLAVAQELQKSVGQFKVN